jgi:hypothetical protein
MISIPRKIEIILICITLIYLLVFTSINLFKTEYDDPPFNYLSKNWLNSPIKSIELLGNPLANIEKINEYDNQKNLGFYKSTSQKQDLNIFMNKFFKIQLYKSYYYPNFVGFFHKKDKNKICGKDTQGNLMYFPKNAECPINYIAIDDTNNNIFCNDLNINCKYQQIDDNKYLVTSNENIEGEIITQLRINYNNEICADSSVDITFNDLLVNDDFEKKECSEENGFDKTYHVIGEENVDDFLIENNLKFKLKKIEKLFLSYRGYLGVDNFEKFSEHPVDHVTYAKKISVFKNATLFIFCFYYIFCSLFIYFCDNKKYICLIKIFYIISFILFAFNFSFDIHVIFTFLRVKGIVSTINLDGIQVYKNGLRWFIVIDIFILFGIVFDFVLRLLQFLIFYKKCQEYKENQENQGNQENQENQDNQVNQEDQENKEAIINNYVK